MKSSLVIGVLAAVMVAGGGVASAQDTWEGGSEPGSAKLEGGGQQSYFLFSPIGPGAGNGTIGMGGRVYLVIPTYDLNYVRGIGDAFDFVLNLNSLGVISIADIGVRFRLVGEPDSGFSMALKAAGTPVVFFIAVGGDTAGGFFFGLTPGVAFGFGSRSTQFTIGFDVPIFLGSAGFVTGDGDSRTESSSGVATVLRPSATIEFGVSEGLNMYVQASAYVATEGEGGFIGPILAVGAAW